MNFSALIPSSMIMGIIRHVLTALGGGLVASGDLDPQSLEVAVGAGMTLIGLIWSLVEKRRQTTPTPAPSAPPADPS